MVDGSGDHLILLVSCPPTIDIAVLFASDYQAIRQAEILAAEWFLRDRDLDPDGIGASYSGDVFIWGTSRPNPKPFHTSGGNFWPCVSFNIQSLEIDLRKAKVPLPAESEWARTVAQLERVKNPWRSAVMEAIRGQHLWAVAARNAVTMTEYRGKYSECLSPLDAEIEVFNTGYAMAGSEPGGILMALPVDYEDDHEDGGERDEGGEEE